MSRSEEPVELPPTVSYEVSFPADAPQHRVALEGLAQAYGWSIRQTPPPAAESAIEDDALVTETDMRAVSAELFGKEHYGDTAYSIIRRVKEQYGRLSIVASGGSVRFEPAYGMPELGSRVIAAANADEEEIKQSACQILEDTGPPFNFDFVRTEKQSWSYEAFLCDIAPLTVTKQRLAAFTVRRGYVDHELHGTLGKALDVMNVVAGSAAARLVDEVNATHYVQSADVIRLARGQGKSLSVVETVTNKIIRAVIAQVRTGKPLPPEEGGELVTEGRYDATARFRDEELPELLALDSLVRLGKTIRSNSKAGPFLQNLPQLL
ncbi:MAG TPA: hypothetical protein VK978_02790 [Candidatus Saccharimonadales bacterium]|nr:hypothetical protein [Candidatus Saccharimonadales bacterium]